MMLTKDQLSDLIPAASDKNIDLFYQPINETLREYRIDNRLRIAAFLAQIAHESGSLRYVSELWGPTDAQRRYDLPHKKATGLGNDTPEARAIADLHDMTPGRFYSGHGLIQVTGYYNHQKIGRTLGIDAVNNPKLLCEPKWAARSAGLFWVSHGLSENGNWINLNELADHFRITDITRIVNGGLNGINERKKMYEHNLRTLPDKNYKELGEL